MSPTQGWQQYYERAIVETDRSRLPGLIRIARAAIGVRIEQLRFDSHDSLEERRAIEDALARLRALKPQPDSN